MNLPMDHTVGNWYGSRPLSRTSLLFVTVAKIPKVRRCNDLWLIL